MEKQDKTILEYLAYVAVTPAAMKASHGSELDAVVQMGKFGLSIEKIRILKSGDVMKIQAEVAEEIKNGFGNHPIEFNVSFPVCVHCGGMGWGDKGGDEGRRETT